MIEKTPPDRASNFLAVLLILAALLLWEASVHLTGTPVYLLPAPSRVLWTLARQPLYYLQASGVTLLEAFAGLLLGAMFGMGLAILLNLAPRLERGMMSLAILIKSTPLAAIAPLLTIWFGFGMLPKVIITALLTFFPTLVNVLVGFQSAERELIDLMHVHRATRWQVLRHLKLYLALPYLFAALRVVAPLSLVGAVVAEWSGASGGLGRIMWLAYANLNLPAMFAAIFILSACGMIAYLLIVAIEQRLLRWR
jgi:ABC-type nitrate/sulfonate/bicarbonate transport system permease component